MNRIETVTTTVRPIRKLFVINDSDIKLFIDLIRLTSREIAGITNLILPSGPELFEENITSFIEQQDPDIIINYSTEDTTQLKRHFRIDSFSAPSLDEVQRFASTTLETWDNLQTFFARALTDKGPLIYSVIAKKDSDVDLFTALHYGIMNPRLSKRLKDSIFEKFRFVSIEQEDASKYLHDYSQNLSYLSLGLSLSSGGGWSLYEKDTNPQGYFHDKPTLVLGSYNNLRSMLYFWNSRAAYPFNHTLWLPIELLGKLSIDLSRYTHLASPIPGIDNSPEVAELQINRTHVDSSKYYFPLHVNHWLSFEHTATAVVVNGRIKVDHPSAKLFSRNGLNMDVALETQGSEEMINPVSAAVGRLFIPPDEFNPLGFSRIGIRGLATRIRQFEIFRDTPLHESLGLPDDSSIMRELFAERGVSIEPTRTSASIEQLKKLLGGYGGAKLLASEAALQLLRVLAPRRTKRIIDEIKLSGLNISERSARELARHLTTVPVLNQPLTMTLRQLEGSIQIRKSEKDDFHTLIQELYNRGILLRGKSMQCPHCKTRLWHPLESLTRPLSCYCCSSQISLPVAPDTEADDSYRLNELLVQAVDQGLVAVILTMRLLWEQLFWGRRLLASLMMYPKGASKPTLETDIAFTLGTDLGLCEVKTEQDFDLVQADELMDLADFLRVDLVIFSTLKKRTEETTAVLEDHIRSSPKKYPVLILTRNALTSTKIPRLAEYYRAQHLRSKDTVFVIDGDG